MPDDLKIESAKDLLADSPFVTAGTLDLKTGKNGFVKLEMHEEFKERVKQMSVQNVSLWSLAGPIGIGRTWSLSWLARQAINDNMGDNPLETRWEAALVSGLGGSGSIRNLIELIFQTTSYLRDDAVDNLEEFSDTATDDYDRIFQYALRNEDAWSVLTGDVGRFPSIPNVSSKPRWPKRQTQLDFLRIWLEYLNEIGVDNLLILVDEFEVLVTRLSKNKLLDLSDGLRSLYDVVESNKASTPNVEIIMSLTPEAANRIEAGNTHELAGWIQALQDRMGPPFMFSKISYEDAQIIAKECIDRHRVVEVNDPFDPFTEAAVRLAYEASDGGLPRKFIKSLEQMYTIGQNKRWIDEETAREAIKIHPDLSLNPESIN